MSMSINKVILVGNVGSTPEIQEVNGYDVANFTLATYVGGYTKSDGTQIPEKTQWHRVVAWRGLAKLCRHVTKGDRVMVMGSVEYNMYEKDGQKLSYTNIVATDIIPPKKTEGTASVSAPVVGAQAPMPKAQFMEHGTNENTLPF